MLDEAESGDDIDYDRAAFDRLRMRMLSQEVLRVVAIPSRVCRGRGNL